MSFCLSSCPVFLQQGSVRRRVLLSMALGALAALAFPPFNLWPLLWFSFPALFLLVQSAQNLKQAFGFGWSFSFGLLVVCLHWIAGALFVDIRSFWWALPFALAGLPACFALYYGVASAVAWKWGLHRSDSPFVLALCWFLAEIARGHLFTGFPWDILGYVWSDNLQMIQITSLIGVEGLTLLTLFLVFAPALFALKAVRTSCAQIALLLLVALFLGFGVWGQARLAKAYDDAVPNVRVRLVQSSLDQAMKWKPEKRIENFEKILQASFSDPGEKPITHYIWPETATAYRLAAEPELRARIAERMEKGSILLTGVVRQSEGVDGMWNYYNSLIAMDNTGSVISGYDKYHLVPFGEYMPFRSVVPIRAISMMGSDFTAGEAIRTIRVPSFPPLSPLVCYEAIFSGETAEKLDRPQLLVNVTNDAWYDGTMGPRQHFLISRMRAVEEGLPMIRVANKGISAVIDAWGRVWKELPAETSGFVDADLPVSPATRTLFSVIGNKISWLICGISIVILVCSRLFNLSCRKF